MMAVPESEEVGFKRIGLSASDYGASLPIKKRRFPVVQSSPSPSKDISSFHLDGNLMKTEQPSAPKDVTLFHTDENLTSEPPSLSVAIVSSSSADRSSGLSDKNCDLVSEENKDKSDTDSCYVGMVSSDNGTSGVKFQEPSLGGHACFDGYVKCEVKSLVTEKYTGHKSPEICGGRELSSTALNPDPLACKKEEEIDVKVEVAEVPAGLSEHIDPILVPRKSDLSVVKQNSLEPVLLDLSLNKEGSSAHCVEGNLGSDYDGSLLHSKRENWDLNTSIESWEGCTSDAPVEPISATQTNMVVDTNLCSSKMVESDNQCREQTLVDSEHRGNSINACIPSKDHLHLSLYSSYPKSMLDEDPYLFEYDSDSNWDIAESVDDDNVEDDYEDGEVRETVLETKVEVHMCEEREIEPFDHADCDDKKINSVELPDHECFPLGPLSQKTIPENQDVRSEGVVHTRTKSKSFEHENEDLCVEDLHAVEITINEDVKRPVNAPGRSQLSQYDENVNFEGRDTADKTMDGIQQLIPTVSQGEVEYGIAVDVVQDKDKDSTNVKDSVNSDINSCIKTSRIISLNRASADSSPCKSKSGFIRSVLSRTDREFVPGMTLEGANMQPQERDEAYGDVSKKFSVDRYRDQSPWMDFNHRRGRSTNNRLDTRSGEWDFGPNFSPETYSDQQIDYHVPGLDQNQYSPFGGANHRGRQFRDDEGPVFFHGPSSRRKSPGRRHHGPRVHDGKMVNRMPRDFSPNRCMDEGGSFNRQHGENPIYARPQPPPYEMDRPFFRERRNFSFQRKVFPRIDSKSPVRSRDRSPTQWFSSKRSDRFYGRPDMTHRRPPSYRMDRMRSPDHRPMHGQMAGRRQGFRFHSPSDDTRDVGPAPDHGPIRSIRNQAERLPPLRNRSFDDPRRRIGSDEPFDGPVRSGGYNSGGEQDNEERRFNERHETVNSFKHPYDDSDGERFRDNNGEDCSRSFRYCGENESTRVSWKRR